MKHKVPFYLENPRSSRIWMWPTIRKIMRDPLSAIILVDYCQFGTPWKKPTQVLCWGNPHITSADNRTCKGKNGHCPKNNSQHAKLNGRDPCAQTGEWKTTTACPCLLPLCDYIAPLLLAPYRETYCERQPVRHWAQALGQSSSVILPAKKAHEWRWLMCAVRVQTCLWTRPTTCT